MNIVKRICLYTMMLFLLAPVLFEDLWSGFRLISLGVRCVAVLYSLFLLITVKKHNKAILILCIYIVYLGVITVIKDFNMDAIMRFVAKYMDIFAVSIIANYLLWKDTLKFAKFWTILCWLGLVINVCMVFVFPSGIVQHIGELGAPSDAFLYDYDNHFIFKYIPSLALIYIYGKYYCGGKKREIQLLIAIILCLISLLYRRSIASLIALITVLMILLFERIVPQKLLSSKAVWLGYIVVSIVLIIVGTSDIIGKVVLALGKGTAFTVRQRMWTNAIAVIRDNPFFGVGVLNTLKQREMFLGLAQLHNSLLNILLWGGIVGLLIYSAFIFSLFSCTKNSKYIKDYKFIFALFVAIMIASLFDGVELNQNVYFYYIIAYRFEDLIEAGKERHNGLNRLASIGNAQGVVMLGVQDGYVYM